MSYFTKNFYQKDFGMLQCYFNAYYTAKGQNYHVYSKISYNRFYRFILHENDGVWKIIETNDVPACLFELENNFSDAIISHLSNGPP